MRTLFAAVSLLVAGLAHAGNITYTIVDYPALQTDTPPSQNGALLPADGTDYVSGTITTDGKIGPLSATDMLSTSITLTTPRGIFACALDPQFPLCSGLSATEDALVLIPSGEFRFFASDTTRRYENMISYVGTRTYNQYLGVVSDSLMQQDPALWVYQLPLTDLITVATVNTQTVISGSWTVTNPAVLAGTNLIIQPGGALVFDPSVSGSAVTAVPEPSSECLLGCAAGIFLGIVVVKLGNGQKSQ